MPRIVRPTGDTIRDAAQRLRNGQLVAFPTETVYGLGAATSDHAALGHIYELKGRPSDNPLIAHVRDTAQAAELVEHWDDQCAALAERFWPGPLTLVLVKRDHVPMRATAGLPTIAVRCPRHDAAQALLDEFGGAISAPSANRSGHVSPTSAQHVADDFAHAAGLLILDGGPSEVGLESTVLDASRRPMHVLRPGSVTASELRDVVGDVRETVVRHQVESPGTSPRHYAPHVMCELVHEDQLARRLGQLETAAAVLCFDESQVGAPHRAYHMARAAETYARRLYDVLREADRIGVDRILIERPPETGGMWDVIHDRLIRATAP